MSRNKITISDGAEEGGRGKAWKWGGGKWDDAQMEEPFVFFPLDADMDSN